jgi:ligand-binding sensor domain-containing protein
MRPIHQLYKIGFCWLFLWPFLLHAQSFRYNQYTTYNGLPIDNIYAAAQDGNGFMWFATNFGISKFDGHDFYNYGKKNGINNMAVMDIVYAGGDSLVFISYPNTIQSIHYDGKINTLINEPNYSFHQLARHQNDIYGYHRNDQNYLFLHTGKWKTCNADSSLGGKDIKIHTIFSLRERGVAFCTTQGLYIMQEGLVTHLLPGQNVQIGILTTKNNILVVSNNFITEIDPQLRVTKTSLQMPTGFLPYQVEEEHGNIWFRNIEKGVIRLQNNVLDEMSAALNLTGKTINKFFTDRDGNFWINTDGNGVLLQKNTHFGIYDIQDGLPNNKVLDLLQQGDKLYIGTENGMAEKKRRCH